MRGELSKETMFRQAGRALSDKMRTGNEWFDRHLEDLRMDDFGNVMHLRAPHWSDISAQFTHGFPRRLIAHSHGSLLPGNVEVAARISNQAVRSMSTGEMNSPQSVSICNGFLIQGPCKKRSPLACLSVSFLFFSPCFFYYAFLCFSVFYSIFLFIFLFCFVAYCFVFNFSFFFLLQSCRRHSCLHFPNDDRRAGADHIRTDVGSHQCDKTRWQTRQTGPPGRSDYAIRPRLLDLNITDG